MSDLFDQVMGEATVNKTAVDDPEMTYYLAKQEFYKAQEELNRTLAVNNILNLAYSYKLKETPTEKAQDYFNDIVNKYDKADPRFEFVSMVYNINEVGTEGIFDGIKNFFIKTKKQIGRFFEVVGKLFTSSYPFIDVTTSFLNHRKEDIAEAVEKTVELQYHTTAKHVDFVNKFNMKIIKEQLESCINPRELVNPDKFEKHLKKFSVKVLELPEHFGDTEIGPIIQEYFKQYEKDIKESCKGEPWINGKDIKYASGKHEKYDQVWGWPHMNPTHTGNGSVEYRPGYWIPTMHQFYGAYNHIRLTGVKPNIKFDKYKSIIEDIDKHDVNKFLKDYTKKLIDVHDKNAELHSIVMRVYTANHKNQAVSSLCAMAEFGYTQMLSFKAHTYLNCIEAISAMVANVKVR